MTTRSRSTLVLATLVLATPLGLGACGGSTTPAEPVQAVAPTPTGPTAAPSGPTAEPELPPPPKHVDPPKIALVLGGGGARGFAHIGVLRILEQEKIPINLIVGTSVGSVIGAMYASEPNTFELEWKAFEIDKDDFFDFSIFSATTGPVKGEAIQKFIRETIKRPRIESFSIPFVAIATDLNTGERIEIDQGNIVDAVRASVSIPGVFTPAKLGSRTVVDGGVVANLGVSVARSRGADIIIASDIGQKVVSYSVENVVDITMQAINIMMGEMAKVEAQKADVLITPDIGEVGTMDFSQKKRCMSAGIEATRRQVQTIRQAIIKYYRDRGGEPPAELVGRM